MKPLIIFSAILFSLLGISKKTTDSADNITVCHDPNLSATENFALLVNDPGFVDAHKTPRPITFDLQDGQNISFDTPDGKKGNAFQIKAKSATNNYLFVIHEWWGLNEHIKQEAQKLYGDLGNVNILALDLYDGEVTSNPQEAGKLMGGVKTERAESIIKGAMNLAGSNAKIYTIGWCFGGGWSLQTALLSGSQAGGSVMYYGMPEANVDKLKMLQTDVLGIWAGQERWINPEIVAKFEANMKEAGKTLVSKSYDANHAFANPSQPSYKENEAKQAYQLTLNFFKERIN